MRTTHRKPPVPTTCFLATAAYPVRACPGTNRLAFTCIVVLAQCRACGRLNESIGHFMQTRSQTPTYVQVWAVWELTLRGMEG